MTVSVFDHPFLHVFLGDDALAALFTADADIAAMLRFEAALAKAQADLGIIPTAAASIIAAACDTFVPDYVTLASDTARDGVVVPGFVKALRDAVGDEYRMHVHVGATSQDVIDTSLVLRLADALDILEQRLATLSSTLDTVRDVDGDAAIMGRTRMQRALPMTYGDRIDGWRAAILRHQTRLIELRPRFLCVQVGGAVGTLDRLGAQGPAVVAGVARELGLGAPTNNWHSARDSIVELADWLSRVSGTTGKIGQDIALMAQNEVAEVIVEAGGGSSAMPHKNNPIAAEALMTLARFNATQVSGMHHAMMHEGERSGEAWTLEWMILPQMIVATGNALNTSVTCLQTAKINAA